jgi:hypothetical protein
VPKNELEACIYAGFQLLLFPDAFWDEIIYNELKHWDFWKYRNLRLLSPANWFEGYEPFLLKMAALLISHFSRSGDF